MSIRKMPLYCRLLLFVLITLSHEPYLFAQQVDPAFTQALHWRLVGPASPAGRAWKVVGLPSDPKTFYVTTAGGGLWKTTNHGTTIKPIFEHEGSASTGAVAVGPSNSNLVWLGSGEPASTRANSWGDGLYKSIDGGTTWKHMGLSDSRQISSIVIDPRDEDIVYVGAMGHLWGANEERGVFKTIDGGVTWEKILFVDETTGAIDMDPDPKNPDVLYASMWDRFRYGGGDMRRSGPGSGIFKTIDAGKTWKKLETGLPTDPMGKIEIAVAFGNTHRVYASVLTGEPAGRGGRTSDQGGIFRSDDGGESWIRVNEMMTSYYYQHIYVDPSDDDTIWMPVFDLWRSEDGGVTLEKRNLTHVHNDLHGMWINPSDPDHFVITGDGGVNVTFDRGESWIQPPLPIGQFYEVAVDNQDPYFVYGGMQDTGHWSGPSRTYDAEGITNHDWIKLRMTGDGMSIQIDPRDSNIIFMCQQFGNFSRLDLSTWTRKELKPDPAEATKRGLHEFRYDWSPPMILSKHDPDVAYFGSNYLLRYKNSGEEWEIISEDLTRQQDKKPRGVVDGYHSYGALFSIAESPLDPEVLWVGSDDGLIHVSRDGGKAWVDVSENFPVGAPTRGVVAEIESSRFDVDRAYVAYDAHKIHDTRPYLYKTEDFGATWSEITNDLPEMGSTWVIREDPKNPNLLFAGTEFGVFFTIDGGDHWNSLNTNLPTCGARAMVIQVRESELVVGTYGRAIWILDIAPLEELSKEILAKDLHLFSIKPGVLFKTRYTYGATIEQLNGDMFFRGENPPFGTTITYLLNKDMDPGVAIDIHDGDGTLVRTLEGPGKRGLHQISWDLAKEASDQLPSGLTRSESEAKSWVSPGSYRATLRTGELSATQSIEVVPEGQGVQRGLIRK